MDAAASALSDGFAVPAGVFAQAVTQVDHFTDRLFRFRVTRPASFRFRSGEFVMIGLSNAEKPAFRAYPIASPSWNDEIEFYSIKVPDGPLHELKSRPERWSMMRCCPASGCICLPPAPRLPPLPV